MPRELTAELLLSGYAQGIFPMAESREDDRLHWVDARQRGIFPLDSFHISRSLRRRILQQRFEIRINTAFADVVRACAARPDTWINAPLARHYDDLHRRGHAQSLEVWQDGVLAGGVFGITLGGAFFGESMFSVRRDASKIALAYLVDHLRMTGFSLFDTQFLTPHLASLGAIEIPRADYRVLLAEALSKAGDFRAPRALPTAQLLMQRCTQIS